MNKYQKEFISTDGQTFQADVYSVLQAFGVACPAVQHAIKKLLMPGQRGAKSELQDLDEALISVCRAIDMARARLGQGGTLAGETEPETKRKRGDAMVCTDIEPSEILAKMDSGQDTSTGGTQAGETEVEPDSEPKRQYYCHVNNCRAESARHPDCVCWHAEGSGPMPDGYRIDSDGNRRELEWRACG